MHNWKPWVIVAVGVAALLAFVTLMSFVALPLLVALLSPLGWVGAVLAVIVYLVVLWFATGWVATPFIVAYIAARYNEARDYMYAEYARQRADRG